MNGPVQGPSSIPVMNKSHDYIGLAALLTAMASRTENPFEAAELLGFAAAARILSNPRITREAVAAKASRLDTYGILLAKCGYALIGHRLRATALALNNAKET